MVIEWVEMQNFLSVGNAKLTLSTPGLCLIEGINHDEAYSISNGSGKSAIIEALHWGLFGTTIRDSTADDVINWQAGKDCQVTVSLTVDGKNYEICRFRAFTALGGNGLTLTSEGSDLTSHRVSDTQKQVDSLLKVTSSVFSQTVILEGGLKSSFSQMTDSLRKQFLEEIVGLEDWEEFQRTSLRKFKDLKALIKEDQRVLQERQSSLTTLEQRAAEIKDAEDSVVNLEEEFRIRSKKLDVEIMTQEDAILQNTEAGDRLSAISNSAQDELDIVAKRKLSRLEALRKCELDRRTVQREVDRTKDLVDRDVCPTCNQPVTELVLADLEKHVIELEDIEKLHEAATELYNAALEIEKQHTDVFALAAQNRETWVSENTTAKDEVHFLKSKLGELAFDYDRRISARRKAESGIDDLISQAAKAFASLKARIDTNDETLRYLDYWKTYAPSIRANITNSVLEYLNARLIDYADFISDGEEIVEMSLVNDKIKILTQVAGNVRMHSLRSSGERRRTDLSIQFAMNDLAVSVAEGRVPPLLILDEVLDTLDPESVSRVFKLLNDRATEQNLKILVTTHSQEVRDQLPESCSVITVVKENGQTQILWQ